MVVKRDEDQEKLILVGVAIGCEDWALKDRDQDIAKTSTLSSS